MIVLKKNHDAIVKGFKKSLQVADKRANSLQCNSDDLEKSNFMLQEEVKFSYKQTQEHLEGIKKLREANCLQSKEIDGLNSEIDRLNKVINESSKKFESKKNKSKK